MSQIFVYACEWVWLFRLVGPEYMHSLEGIRMLELSKFLPINMCTARTVTQNNFRCLPISGNECVSLRLPHRKSLIQYFRVLIVQIAILCHIIMMGWYEFCLLLRTCLTHACTMILCAVPSNLSSEDKWMIISGWNSIFLFLTSIFSVVFFFLSSIKCESRKAAENVSACGL